MEDLLLIIEDAVSALPPRCKEVFRLSREHSMSNRQIAEKMGISSKTVEIHITKALKSLRKAMDSIYFLLL